MAYRIHYGTTITKISYADENCHKSKFHKAHRAIWIVTVCLMLLFIVSYYSDALHSFMIPGNDAVTTAAFSDLEQDIRSGVPIRDALVAFCQEIIKDEA